MIPPVQIATAWDEDISPDGDRHLTVNRADPHDANVVISFYDHDSQRDAIGIRPESAIAFAIAILAAAQEVTR